MTTSNALVDTLSPTPADPSESPERPLETRLGEALGRIAEDARDAAERYARDTEVPEGGE
ncbi:MAG: hypothetical protein VYE22_10615 [Myxococcota bacterium]|nr:hypothetical protein [Myxococcota bacterium]